MGSSPIHKGAVRTTPEAVGDRLTRALEHNDWTVAELRRRLDKASAKIKGYTAIYEYVRGEKAPPLEFFEDAARELGVEQAWLAFGIGPMTLADAAGSGPRTAFSGGLWSDRLTDELRQRLAPRNEMAGVAFWEVLRLLVGTRKENGQDASDDEIRQLGKAIMASVAEPVYLMWDWIRDDSRFVLSQEDQDNYQIVVLNALRVAIQSRLSYALAKGKED